MSLGFRDRLLKGRRSMAHLIHIWHERNSWSHKVLPALADCLDLGRVHNSQISNLRNGKLSSPGPEVFLALSQVNHVLYQGIDGIRDRLKEDHPELLQILADSAIPLLDDDKKPLTAGDLFEIFIGLSPLPSIFDWFIEEEEAGNLSGALSDHLCNKRPWRQCREEVMAAYPVNKSDRRERFAAVMSGLKDYTAEELDGELLDLFATYQKIFPSNIQTVDLFLESLRARVLVPDDSAQIQKKNSL
ncbi:MULTISPECIES: hypothetical protein [Prochlorococcus]|nr:MULTISPECIES: hypothetical protein [Prochlorococcus]KGG10630.1 hypothetical protein EV04_1589 [Prochlorococcus marinus str. LG]KGG19904.1 hypothetical protein EV08_1218 [Prochlorococcus marinus str. SS2]KGG35971.1 hypothetical protein EV11_0994 [Prochlorococcus sp. SS52]